MASSLGIDRKTIRKYLAPAEAVGITPGGPPIGETEWAQRVREWFPELADTRLRQVTWPQIAEHHEFIAGQLAAGVTQATVHQRLVDDGGWRPRMRACAGISRRTWPRRSAVRR